MRSMMTATSILFFAMVVSMSAGEEPRSRTLFDKDWHFRQEDVAGFEKPDFDDSAWRKLSVPHDWSIEGEYNKNNPMGYHCGYLPAGIGCGVRHKEGA